MVNDSQVASAKVRTLEPLTSFRFIAALLVFQWHTHVFGSTLDPFKFGYVGVSFFYVLSGFILTYVYTSRIGSGSRSKIKSFYVARIAKIYPVHLLTFLISLPIAIGALASLFSGHIIEKIFGTALLNLSLTQSFYPSSSISFSFNGVAWSISNEMFFYSLFPLFIYLAVRYRKRITPMKLTAAWFVIWAVLMTYLSTKHASLDDWAYYVLPPLRLIDFTAGIILGLHFLKLNESPDNIFEKISSKYFTLFEIAALVVLVRAMFVSVWLPLSMQFGTFLLPFWAILIFTFSWQKGLISRIFSVKPLVFLGNVSFSFYMIHQLVIRYFALAHINNVPILLIASVSLASVIYIFVEEPYRIRLKTYLEQHRLSRVIPIRLRTLLHFPKPAVEEQPVQAATASTQ